MSLDAMQAVVARLLTDKAYRARFFADDAAAATAHGLTRDEFAVLAQLDPHTLDISGEGFGGKRFERVESAFPRTLAALERLDPRTRARYLEATPFPPSDEAERRAFLAWVRGGAARPEATQRLLDDLADLDALLHAAPPPQGPPAYRWRPAHTRPRRAAGALVLPLRGPLEDALGADPAAAAAAYVHAPHDALVLMEGSVVRLEPLAEPARRLLAACDGTRSAAELARAFGPEAEPALQRWLRYRVVEDAAPQEP